MNPEGQHGDFIPATEELAEEPQQDFESLATTEEYPVSADLPQETEATHAALESQEKAEALLAQLSTENIKASVEVSGRFGSGMLAKLKDIGANSLRKLETSGENALKWAEEKGVPLPKSKLGNYLAASGLGVAGLAPGAGLLWGVAYIFAKRAREAGRENDPSSDTLSADSPRLAAA